MAVAANPDAARKAARQIAARLQGEGHVAWFAGGCVRDELLGLHPTDYDVATDATPDRIAALFKRTHSVGVQFGVMLVRDFGPTIEVATFRADGPYSDRRRPDEITFSDPANDARRRDFTINALFLDPLAADEAGVSGEMIRGHVVDYVGGLTDLKAQVVRAVGDPEQRLAEDHLRALRAVRFAARLGFSLDPGTADAIARHAFDLIGVSRERIGDEVRRMLRHRSRADAAAMLQRLGLDAPTLDEPPVATAPSTLRAVTEALWELSSPPGDLLPAALAAWAVDRHAPHGEPLPAGRAAEVVRRWRVALCLSNPERDGLAAALRAHSVLAGEWAGLGVAARKRLASSPGFWEGWAILKTQYPEKGGSIRAEVATLEAQGGLSPEPLLTGDELIRMGFSPGPRFKEVLEAVYDAQLEGAVGTVDEARELARRLCV